MIGICEKTLITQADFDDELPASEAMAAQLHRRFCVSCQETYATLTSLRSLAATATRYRAPHRLRRTIVAMAAMQRAIPAIRSRRRWLPPLAGFGTGIALAASVMLAVMTPQSNAIVDEIVAGHLRSLQPGHVVDVRREDRKGNPANWFAGRVDFAPPPIKDLAAEGFPLEGCRLDYLAKQPVAAMVYDRSGHPINLFVWPAGTRSDETPTLAAREGYNIVHWEKDGFTLWAVSDVDAGQLDDFARVWQTAGPSGAAST